MPAVGGVIINEMHKLILVDNVCLHVALSFSLLLHGNFPFMAYPLLMLDPAASSFFGCMLLQDTMHAVQAPWLTCAVLWPMASFPWHNTTLNNSKNTVLG